MIEEIILKELARNHPPSTSLYFCIQLKQLVKLTYKNCQITIFEDVNSEKCAYIVNGVVETYENLFKLFSNALLDKKYFLELWSDINLIEITEVEYQEYKVFENYRIKDTNPEHAFAYWFYVLDEFEENKSFATYYHCLSRGFDPEFEYEGIVGIIFWSDKTKKYCFVYDGTQISSNNLKELFSKAKIGDKLFVDIWNEVSLLNLI